MNTFTMSRYYSRILLLAVALFVSVGVSASGTSNKWRMQVSGGANSDGIITILVSPNDGDPISVDVHIKDGTGENHVARVIKDTLKDQLPHDHYHIERDDGEDVLVKKRHGSENFGLSMTSNTVKGVRITFDKE